MALRQCLVSGLLELRSHRFELFPRGRWAVDANFGEDVFVPVEQGCGRVERHADHLAFAVGIEVAHAFDVICAVKAACIFGHQISNRDCRTFGVDDCRGASVENLNDVWLLTRAERGDTGSHRVFVTALIGRNEVIFALARVIVRGDFLNHFAKATTHGVPPLDIGLSKDWSGKRGKACGHQCYHFHESVLSFGSSVMRRCLGTQFNEYVTSFFKTVPPCRTQPFRVMISVSTLFLDYFCTITCYYTNSGLER